ncbi:MAG: hypothetical protein QOG06_35 [Gaiellaceae bacterium]|nr:hypothetical protein [Gaiellaceae bacterium]
MLVDPELAARARELLREPHETNRKGNNMSALGTHEIKAGMSLGLEPPLSPPIVRGPLASAMPTGDGLAGLPTPPPAIRPPESVPTAPAPSPVTQVPEQPEPAPAAAPAPVPVPAPVQPEPELPAMAPEELEETAPVIDYFAADTTPPAREAAPVEELPAVEPAPAVELHSVPLMAPEATPAPAPEPAVELTPIAPLEPLPAAEPEPVTFVAPEPVEVEPIALELEPEPEPVEVDIELPVVEPFEVADPFTADEELPVAEDTPSPDLDELFAPKRGTFNVVVRLKDSEGVEVGSFRDFGTAMEGAQEVIEQFSNATEGQWPFYAGRFIRPDLIVSVDVVES